MHEPLHYRNLKKCKMALKQKYGNFDSLMSLSQKAKCKLQWWVLNVERSHNAISHLPFEHQITTDASLLGGEQNVKGYPLEHHINYLKMLAIYSVLQTFT